MRSHSMKYISQSCDAVAKGVGYRVLPRRLASSQANMDHGHDWV